jgi:acyl-CoA-binding protein
LRYAYQILFPSYPVGSIANEDGIDQGRKKWDKWDELSKSGLSAEEARKNYVNKFNELKDKHGLKDA